MTFYRIGLLYFCAVFLVACYGSAPVKPSFSELDSDGNNRVEWREFHERIPESTPKGFLEADLDKDGQIRPEEWQVLLEK